MQYYIHPFQLSNLFFRTSTPYHTFFQFYVANGELSCQLYQRSADIFLGVPFNIASYALAHAHDCAANGHGRQRVHLDGRDCHLYNNHFEQAETQLARELLPLPKRNIKRKPDSIFDYEFEDYDFLDDQHQAPIKAPVAV